jgi:hypothetical protein
MNILQKQGRSLEDQFFAAHNRQLMESARHEEERGHAMQRLREASGITDTQVLGELLTLHIHPETLVALSMVPLIEVSWSDGKIDDKEREAILAAAESRGVGKDSAAHRLLENWLRKCPTPALLKTWRTYARALLAALPAEARASLRDDILNKARIVAEAAGGFWGLGNRVSDKEQAALDSIREALDG